MGTQMSDKVTVEVDGGKYAVVIQTAPQFQFYATRYGLHWDRSLVGDKLVLALATELHNARLELDQMKERLEEADRKLAAYERPAETPSSRFSLMLHPENFPLFDTVIPRRDFEILQKNAEGLLNGVYEPHVISAEKIDHWQGIVSGVVPFGYSLLD